MDLMSSLCLIVVSLVAIHVSKIEKQQKELIDKIDSLRRMISDSLNRIPFSEDDIYE